MPMTTTRPRTSSIMRTACENPSFSRAFRPESAAASISRVSWASRMAWAGSNVMDRFYRRAFYTTWCRHGAAVHRSVTC